MSVMAETITNKTTGESCRRPRLLRIVDLKNSDEYGPCLPQMVPLNAPIYTITTRVMTITMEAITIQTITIDAITM